MRDSRRKGFSDPVSVLVAANLHASTALTNGVCDCIFVTVAGNLACRPAGNTDAQGDVILALERGWHPLRLSHTRATSTTATVFVGYR